MEKTDPHYHEFDKGAYYWCKKIEIATGHLLDYWSEWQNKDTSKPAVDPGKLAEKAIVNLHMTTPQIGIVPKTGKGIIGVPIWLWVANPQPTTVGPITDTASDGDTHIRITARLGTIVWNMGDGTTITCKQGTPWTPDRGKEPSPTCGHTYQKISTYTITGTVHWTVDWEGQGRHGTLTPTLQTPPITLDMKDIQVLNVNPNK